MCNLKITFLNNNVLKISSTDSIIAYKSGNDPDNHRPYAKNLFEDKLENLSIGEILGLFGACETFTLYSLLHKNIYYKTSAIYTIEKII